MSKPFSIFNETEELKRLSEMVFVEGETFLMGNEDVFASRMETPIHSVFLDSYYIGKFPVTQALWEKVIDRKSPSHFKGSNRPVENVLLYDVDKFITQLNNKTTNGRTNGMEYRLPTEAEWEYAAIGGKYWNTLSVDFDLSDGDKLNERAWYDANSHKETKPVGLKTPNILGLYDMSGNIWEMCEDKYKSHFYKECYKNGVVSNPYCDQGSNSIIRGGSYGYLENDCRPTHRFYRDFTDKNDDMGFRLVLSNILI
jgi:formylglycine-generating enzyme required for sulfatase activity